jgi:hypothetical protein
MFLARSASTREPTNDGGRLRPEAQAIYAAFAKGYAPIAKSLGLEPPINARRQASTCLY